MQFNWQLMYRFAAVMRDEEQFRKKGFFFGIGKVVEPRLRLRRGVDIGYELGCQLSRHLQSDHICQGNAG